MLNSYGTSASITELEHDSHNLYIHFRAILVAKDTKLFW